MFCHASLTHLSFRNTPKLFRVDYENGSNTRVMQICHATSVYAISYATITCNLKGRKPQTWFMCVNMVNTLGTKGLKKIFYIFR